MSELKLQQCRLDGRYDILECLGRGSYAEVYLSRDMAAQAGAPQSVVIKALNLFLQGSIDVELERTLIENFRNEAVALDRARHPNIINRLGHGTAIDLTGQTFHYLVLEYLPGGDMSTLCRHHPLMLERALFYLEQVCAGLAHAHVQGVIHRDIKPQNLLLTADRETVKIADFGVAKIEAGDGAITRVGTDVYAAPEHHPLMQTGPLDPSAITQPIAHLTPAADIYSLAKTAYMLLTGEAPRRFSQKPVTALPEQFAGEPWANFVLRVLQRATETNPSKRYQSVSEFWDELRDAAMPQTRLLTLPESFDETTSFKPQNGNNARATLLPPEPTPARFEPHTRPAATQPSHDVATHARIVVPISMAQPEAAKTGVPESVPSRLVSAQKISQTPIRLAGQNAATTAAAAAARPTRKARLLERARLWIVIALLVAGFALMLLGTYHYVRSQHAVAGSSAQPTSQITNVPALQVGREMLTITDVNLRNGPSRSYDRVGLAEQGSRVRIMQINGSWCEVLVLQHSRTKDDPESADEGWLDGTRLR